MLSRSKPRLPNLRWAVPRSTVVTDAEREFLVLLQEGTGYHCKRYGRFYRVWFGCQARTVKIGPASLAKLFGLGYVKSDIASDGWRLSLTAEGTRLLKGGL